MILQIPVAEMSGAHCGRLCYQRDYPQWSTKLDPRPRVEHKSRRNSACELL